MSIARTVYVHRSKMLTSNAWADAIRAAGFSMDLDTDFDVESHSGYLPCQYDGQSSGFEYYFSTVADAEDAPEVGDRDVSVAFVTHSSLRELATAVVAAAVLCAKADGMLHDEESGEFVAATDALDDARAMLESIGDDLE
jgi:hypothetical protein